MGRKALFDLIQNSKADKTDLAEKFKSDYIYTLEHLEDDYTPSKSFKPSSIKCIRSGVYQCLGISQDNTKQSQTLYEICQNGTNTHLSIQENVMKMGFGWKYEDVGQYVKDNNIDLEIIEPSDFEHGVYETKLYNKKYNIRFLCDGIVSYTNKRGKKEYVIFEIKTCGSGKFYPMKDVLEEHKQQAICYCILLHLDKVLFFYSERDMLSKKAFIYEPTKKEKEELIKKLEYGNKCVKEHKIPKKPINANNRFCAYCQYQSRCDNDGADECEANI